MSSYEDLLDQEKNIATGAEVLSEAIESSQEISNWALVDTTIGTMS